MNTQSFWKTVIILALSALLLGFSACDKNKNSQIPKSLADYLKNQGVQDMQVDLLYQPSDIPDKKYISLTATYNYATSSGAPQKEFLGYVLKKEGSNWKVDHNTNYTKNEQTAKDLILGNGKSQ
jgi:hypothetical protein